MPNRVPHAADGGPMAGLVKALGKKSLVTSGVKGWSEDRLSNYTANTMDMLPRHQCLIYEGDPTRHLRALAATLGEKLRRNYRCLYLNSPTMVEGMRSLLAAAGVDVAAATARGSL